MSRRTPIADTRDRDVRIGATAGLPHVAETSLVTGRRATRRIPERTLAPSPAALDRFRRAGLIGESAALLHALALAERSALSTAPIALEGETGTGKELLARVIHDLSDRRTRAFVAQNCAALAEGTLESELFGHTRGAFTGADSGRRGLFEIASGGTLFLDEVSETSPSAQAKLLRTLQEGEVRPLGSERTRRVDVRLITACNRDLRAEVARGRFRADLYHRLSTLPILLPPLRDRPGDVEILTDHLLRELGGPRGGRGLERAARTALAAYPWPGNVRELRNEVERLLTQSDPGGDLRLEDVAEHIRGAACPADPGPGRTLREIVDEVERTTILARLRLHADRRSATARSLGISREALWAKMRRLGCQPRGRRR